MVYKSVSPSYPASRGPYAAAPSGREASTIEKYCGKCGRGMGPTDNFCPKCGQKHEPGKWPKNACVCGTAFGPQDRFCTSCGKPHQKKTAGPAAARKKGGS